MPERTDLPTDPPSRKIRILLVDDEESILEMLQQYLTEQGYSVECMTSGSKAISRISESRFDLLILDFLMPEMSGLEVLRQAREIDNGLSVIIMTGHGSVDSAVEAIKFGAEDYLLKPLELDTLQLAITRTLNQQQLRLENRLLREQSAAIADKHAIIARSKSMLDILGLAAKVAPLRSTVLIQGESGTGKELLARAIHAGSARSHRRFVAVNCGVIPVTLLESELFGHERGSFTGADSRRIGYFEEADGGTIFLDEVSETPLDLQVKLLRVLQERTFRRLGGTEEIAADARVIASTNRNLEEQVRLGKFREDLYYRLNVIRLHMPPLRERPEDIPLLAHHFLVKYAREFGKPMRALSAGAMEWLLRQTWPGNVRELENAIERAVAVIDGNEIGPADITALPHAGIVTPPGSTDPFAPPLLLYADAKAGFERKYIETIMKASKWNIALASRMAGLARQNLYKKLRKLRMEKEAE